jgi:hypothetical protein
MGARYRPSGMLTPLVVFDLMSQCAADRREPVVAIAGARVPIEEGS